MANTIKSLSERILRILNAGDVPQETRFIMRDIEYMVRDSLGKQIQASWFAGRQAQESKDIADAFISNVTLTLQIDTRNPVNNFVELLFDCVDLPDEGGVQSVRPAIAPALITELPAFIPTPARYADIYRGLPAGALEGQIGWSLRGKRIYFSRKNGQTLTELGYTTVEVEVISTSDIAMGQERPLPIPPNMAIAIITEVVGFFMPFQQMPKDMLNDASPNLKPVAP